MGTICAHVYHEVMRVLLLEDEPFIAEGVRDYLRLQAIAADIARDGDAALELLTMNSYDLAVLDRDVPGPSGDDVAKTILASGVDIPILMLTAADRIDDKISGFALGADDYLTKPFELAELVLRLRALDRRRERSRPQRKRSRVRMRNGVPVAPEPRWILLLPRLCLHLLSRLKKLKKTGLLRRTTTLKWLMPLLQNRTRMNLVRTWSLMSRRNRTAPLWIDSF